MQQTEAAISRMDPESSLGLIERHVADVMRRVCKSYNSRRPEVVVIAYEPDPRAVASRLSRTNNSGNSSDYGGGRSSRQQEGRWRAPPSRAAPADMLERRRQMNPRENLAATSESSAGSPRSSSDDDLAFD